MGHAWKLNETGNSMFAGLIFIRKQFLIAALTLALSPTLLFASDHWENRARGPSKRTGNTAVWTGREMIIWGGGSQSVWLGDGGVYDLDSDTWRPTSNI